MPLSFRARRVARFKDAHAMFYKPEMVDPWRVPHDSVAALSDAIEQLTMWLESTDRSLPGVRVLERRRRDCVEEYTESCRRRTEEGRPLPANLENVLKAEWTVMSNAASQLRAMGRRLPKACRPLCGRAPRGSIPPAPC